MIAICPRATGAFGRACLASLLGGALFLLVACQFDKSGLRSPSPDAGGGVCGNGIAEPGEACDGADLGGGTCAAEGFGGGVLACSGSCAYDTSGCVAAVCGNGVVEAGERCDPPSACPTSCDDGGSACTVGTLSGSAATCDAMCSYTLIETCAGGDGCCPAGCNAANDSDCSATCGDGVVDPGETCDPQSTCPTVCVDDGDACTTETLSGSAANCNAECEHTPITACVGGDGCCPGQCTAVSDTDCAPICDNGVVEPGETCDPQSTCPVTCEDDGDVCTTETLSGSAATCDAVCAHTPITACIGGDGCCPGNCDAVSDTDCAPVCDNGVLEPGETCDPRSTCPVACVDDGDVCTTETLSGSAANCDAVCAHTPITTCTGGDGCCPGGCTPGNDSDCSILPPDCGNGVLDSSEECDDGNTLDGDGCDATCHWEQTCTADAALVCGASDQSAPSGNDVHDYSCIYGLSENGPERVYSFTPQTSGTVTVSVARAGMGDYDLAILEGACNPELCSAAAANTGDDNVSFPVTAGTTYYIVVERYLGSGGFTVAIECQ